MKSTPLRMRALQVVMLRLTVDPGFGEALYRGDPAARHVELAGGPYVLTDADLALFRAVDARAWTTDVYRRTRLVQALIEEYALTTAIVGVPIVHRFFETPAFAHVLGHHGSMAEGFGDWVQTCCEGANREIARLEGTICRARRDHRPDGPGLVAAPGKAGVTLRAGTLAAWQEGLATLGGQPIQAAATGLRWTAPPLERGREHWLIERNPAGGLGVHPLSAGVVGLMDYCRIPRSRTEVSRQARKLKIGKKAVSSVLRRMQDDGLLTLQDSILAR